MENQNIISLIRQKMGIMILWGVLIAVLSFVILINLEKKYKVSTDFLVIQNQTGNQDYYSLSKSAEYISKILSESIHSELFIDEVIKTGKIHEEFLPFDKRKKLESWRNIVNVRRNFQLGIISIEILEDRQKDALNLSRGIADVMSNKNDLFRGENQNISVKTLSGPITERNPDSQKVVAVVTGGFLVGMLFSFLWVYYRDEKERQIFSNYNESRSASELKEDTQIEPDEYEESLKYMDE